MPRRKLLARETWTDKAAYDRLAIKLVQVFRDKFKKFEAHVGADIKGAAPRLAAAAEQSAVIKTKVVMAGQAKRDPAAQGS